MAGRTIQERAPLVNKRRFRMTSDAAFVSAQILAVVSCAICMGGMQCKTLKNILLSIVLGSVFGVSGLLLLGATTGAALQAVFGIQALINYFFARKEIPVGKIHAAIYITIGIICGFATYRNVIDLLPVCASILHTLAILQTRESRLREVNLLSLSLWVPYYIASGAFGNLISVAAIGSSNVIGIIRLDFRGERDGYA